MSHEPESQAEFEERVRPRTLAECLEDAMLAALAQAEAQHKRRIGLCRECPHFDPATIRRAGWIRADTIVEDEPCIEAELHIDISWVKDTKEEG